MNSSISGLFQRYHPNTFIKNNKLLNEDDEFIYYIRPFVPFWSFQKMTFESVNNRNIIPKRVDDMYKKRNVSKMIVRTWLGSNDANWFDTEEIYKEVESSLILRLNSKTHGQNQKLICEYISSITFIYENHFSFEARSYITLNKHA